MMARASILWGLLSVLGFSAAGCNKNTDAFKGEQVAVSVGALSLADVSDVGWKLSVTNGDGQLVWDKSITSAKYGTGDGSANFIGPCDGQSNPNTVTLELESLTDADGQLIPAGEYATPPPMSRDVSCIINGDAPVSFDVTVARAANQGFFDVAVTFDDIFCSAKLDCLDEDDLPIELLHNGGVRDTTVVVAWACTTGTDGTHGGAGAATATWLHMDALVFECSDGTRVVHNPSQGPGNAGASPPYVFQRAVYRGMEELPGYDKCYWNQAIGIDDDVIPAGVDCTISGKATASTEKWLAGNSPEGYVWPVIEWNVPVVTDGQLSCGHHPIGAGPEVTTTYTTIEGERFFYSMECGAEVRATPNGTVCSGQISGFGEDVVFAGTTEGVVLAVGDKVTDPMELPAGATLIEDCCMDPCCSE